MYKLFESHVYSAHSVTKNATARNDVRRPTNQPSQGIPNRSQLQVTPRPMPTSTSSANFKPLKINDEITIIPQPMANAAQRSKGSLTITPQPAPRRNGKLMQFHIFVLLVLFLLFYYVNFNKMVYFSSSKQ